jgi:hypothetical protein
MYRLELVLKFRSVSMGYIGRTTRPSVCSRKVFAIMFLEGIFSRDTRAVNTHEWGTSSQEAHKSCDRVPGLELFPGHGRGADVRAR